MVKLEKDSSFAIAVIIGTIGRYILVTEMRDIIIYPSLVFIRQ